MIIVEVTFKIDSSLTEEILREKFLETAPIYKTTPGLIMKELNGSQIDIRNPN